VPQAIATSSNTFPSSTSSGMLTFSFNSPVLLAPGSYYFLVTTTNYGINTLANTSTFTDQNTNGNSVNEQYFQIYSPNLYQISGYSAQFTLNLTTGSWTNLN
jgi:hypothetical protein